MPPERNVAPPFSPITSEHMNQGWHVANQREEGAVHRMVQCSLMELTTLSLPEENMVAMINDFCLKHNLELIVINPSSVVEGVLLPEDAWNVANFDYSQYRQDGDLDQTFNAVVSELLDKVQQQDATFDVSTLAVSRSQRKVFLLPR